MTEIFIVDMASAIIFCIYSVAALGLLEIVYKLWRPYMTEAKEEFYDFKKECDQHHEGLVDPIQGYVDELEGIKNEILGMFREYTIWLNDNGYIEKDMWGSAPDVVEKFMTENQEGKKFMEKIKG